MGDASFTGRRSTRPALTVLLVAGALLWARAPAAAQTVREVFEKVAPSVVIIRARGHEVSAGGQSRFSETGSGVLISRDGHVMTAAHVVHAMDENTVQFLGGGLRGATQVATISGHQVPLGGDIILSVNGIAMSMPNVPRLRQAMNQMASGAPFTVTILRAGQVLELTGLVP